jgi:rhodanese-related sulfurtransferase
MIENLTPEASWALLQQSAKAIMIDVRTTIEHSFIGHPPEAVHIAWKEYPGMKLNEDFLSQVNNLVKDKNTPVLLLCRSGQRSLAAAELLDESGYFHVVNILEGFEGVLDGNKHRGNIDGWKYHNLPWTQV